LLSFKRIRETSVSEVLCRFNNCFLTNESCLTKYFTTLFYNIRALLCHFICQTLLIKISYKIANFKLNLGFR